jgi:hypothetical protein
MILPKKKTVHIIGADARLPIAKVKSFQKDAPHQDKTENTSKADPIMDLLGPNGNQHKS